MGGRVDRAGRDALFLVFDFFDFFGHFHDLATAIETFGADVVAAMNFTGFTLFGKRGAGRLSCERRIPRRDGVFLLFCTAISAISSLFLCSVGSARR